MQLAELRDLDHFRQGSSQGPPDTRPQRGIQGKLDGVGMLRVEWLFDILANVRVGETFSNPS